MKLADNRAGATPAVVEKVTTPFYSIRAGNHTGLGLTPCSHMVSTLKGKLFISRIPDAGTVLHVKVPYHPRRCNRASSRR
ncbi:ATP-binding protein [Mesorhizobium kowhaii]|uniref:ATP-binding protein n=1 Tax=Mesorhizobium kowhaii TaxID=1300272 RepID=UPI0036412EDD